MKRTLEQRLFSKRHIDDNGCWNWIGSLCNKGYAQIQVNLQILMVHRASYELFIGPISGGMTLDHLCKNKRCFNPTHLEQVTNRENILRGNNRAAQQARQTHCKNGHKFNSENTRLWKNHRSCKICSAIWMKAFRERKHVAIQKAISLE